jgi:hypothetical protein
VASHQASRAGSYFKGGRPSFMLSHRPGGDGWTATRRLDRGGRETTQVGSKWFRILGRDAVTWAFRRGGVTPLALSRGHIREHLVGSATPSPRPSTFEPGSCLFPDQPALPPRQGISEVRDFRASQGTALRWSVLRSSEGLQCY